MKSLTYIDTLHNKKEQFHQHCQNMWKRLCQSPHRWRIWIN